jgi:hypothetical protein
MVFNNSSSSLLLDINIMDMKRYVLIYFSISMLIGREKERNELVIRKGEVVRFSYDPSHFS